MGLLGCEFSFFFAFFEGDCFAVLDVLIELFLIHVADAERDHVVFLSFVAVRFLLAFETGFVFVSASDASGGFF
ncbi:MAG: hypothetical protein CMB80_05390 [Flammeovirgaceae bacterium]|nr:hypothetical protein [Flammeovirgaceae bacterium]